MESLIFEAGDIHIWDRDSGFLRRFIPAPSGKKGRNAPELMAVAWNSARPEFMLVTGSYDGGVNVWTPSDMKEKLLMDSGVGKEPGVVSSTVASGSKDSM